MVMYENEQKVYGMNVNDGKLNSEGFIWQNMLDLQINPCKFFKGQIFIP